MTKKLPIGINYLLLVTILTSIHPCKNSHAAALSISSTAANPADLVTIAVDYASANGEQMAACQLDIFFDSTALAVSNVTTGPAAAEASKSASYSIMQPGKCRIIVAGLNLNVIPPGTIALIEIQTFDTARGSLLLDGQNAVASAPGAENVPVTVSDGTLELPPPEAAEPEEGEAVSEGEESEPVADENPLPNVEEEPELENEPEHAEEETERPEEIEEINDEETFPPIDQEDELPIEDGKYASEEIVPEIEQVEEPDIETESDQIEDAGDEAARDEVAEDELGSGSPTPSPSTGACPIACLAQGTALVSRLDMLRAWRECALSGNVLGASGLRFYYSHCASLVETVQRTELKTENAQLETRSPYRERQNSR